MKSEKIYLSANDYLRDSFKLARQVMDSNWLPDVLIALWRGGAPVGVTVHEFFHYHGVCPRHYALKCSSYTGIRTRRRRVDIDNMEYLLGKVSAGERVLVVDDVFDSGCTAHAVLEQLATTGVELRFAAVYWKPLANQTNLKPNYYVRATESWIVFPHELDGLAIAEVLEKDPQIHALLKLEMLTKHTRQRS